MTQTFVYKVRDRGGKTVEGALDADSTALVASKLREMGYVPVSIAPKAGAGMRREIKIPFLSGRVKPADVAVMSRQFATMVDSGLTLLRSLAILGDQTENKALGAMINEARLDVERGSSLSAALARQPKAFSSLYVAMVRAGEIGGVLDSVLRQLATTVEKAVELRRKIKSAMAYPVAVLVLVLVILTAMLVFVVPQFKAIYAQLGGKLPYPTRVLMMVSSLTANYFPLLVIAGGIAAWLGRRAVKTPRGRAAWDAFRLKVPLFGKLIHKTALTRFSQTLAALLRAGVPILESLEITKDTVGNTRFTGAITDMQDGVRGGETIARRLSEHPIFPPMVVQMLAVGEETGAIDTMLEKVGEFYEQEVKAMVDALTSLLEPLLVVVLGSVVGSMVISLYLPLFDVIKLIH
ncbi:MAG: type II secretion system F family protein [Actinomycetota bacterium]|nr:type II secretion system F family protein [Actinomycetota bacterium]